MPASAGESARVTRTLSTSSVVPSVRACANIANVTNRGNAREYAISLWNWMRSSAGAPAPALRKFESPIASRVTPPPPL